MLVNIVRVRVVAFRIKNLRLRVSISNFRLYVQQSISVFGKCQFALKEKMEKWYGEEYGFRSG